MAFNLAFISQFHFQIILWAILYIYGPYYIFMGHLFLLNRKNLSKFSVGIYLQFITSIFAKIN